MRAELVLTPRIQSKMRLPTILFACAALTFAGCASTDNDTNTASEMTTDAAMTVGAVNMKCPISGEELDGDSPTVAYNGSGIGVCCNNCAAKVEAWSDEDKQKFIDDALASK